MADAETIIRRHERMKTERSSWEQLWQEVAQVLLPRQADFLGSSYVQQGQRRTERIFDETAMLSLDHGIAVFEGEVIPTGGIWQRLMPLNSELNKNQRVRLWFESLTDRLFALRNSPYSGFGNQTHESIASLLAFGFQGMSVEKRLDARGLPVGLAYRSEHIGQVYVQEDHTGAVDIVHREFHLTHRQAALRWGVKAPEVALKGMRDQRPDDKACYVQALEPNRDYQHGRIDHKGKPIASCYVSLADKQVFDEGGYRTKPLIASRYEKSPTEDYGRGPAITVLPAVKATQAMMRDLVTSVEFGARPPLLAHDDMQDSMLFFEPGGVSFGGIDDRGNKAIQSMLEQYDISPALQLQEQTRAIIKRAFFEDLYTIRQDVKSHVSATEIMQREQQKGVMLAPLKRQETEWFTPMADREIDLMAEMGMLDDMPPEVAEAGGQFQIVYENPLSRARKAEAAGGFYQLLNGVAPLMQLDPNLGKQFAKAYPFDKVLKGLAEIHAVPVSWESTEEERAAADQSEAAQTQLATVLDVGDRASQIAKNLGGAGGAGMPAA